MTKDQLRDSLEKLEVGEKLIVPYSTYEEIFPPGEPDENARAACYDLARAAGCRIENHREAMQISFIRNVSHPTYKSRDR